MKIKILGLGLLIKFCSSYNQIVNKLAKYSKYAYKDASFPQDKITHFPKNVGLFVFQDKIKRETIITYRGTITFRDWQCNLDFLPIKYPNTKMNGQFHRGYVKIVSQITTLPQFKVLENHIENIDDNILLTGHSSGAAKSILTSLYLASKYENRNFKVVTFGCPKVANKEFYEYIHSIPNLEYISVILRDDVVPHIGIGINSNVSKITIE